MPLLCGKWTLETWSRGSAPVGLWFSAGGSCSGAERKGQRWPKNPRLFKRVATGMQNKGHYFGLAKQMAWLTCFRYLAALGIFSLQMFSLTTLNGYKRISRWFAFFNLFTKCYLIPLQSQYTHFDFHFPFYCGQWPRFWFFPCWDVVPCHTNMANGTEIGVIVSKRKNCARSTQAGQNMPNIDTIWNRFKIVQKCN